MNVQKLSLSFLIVMAILPSLLVGQQTANSSAVVPRLVNFSGQGHRCHGQARLRHRRGYLFNL